MTVATIRLEGLTFEARHGVFEEEQRNGQTFRVDVTLSVMVDDAIRDDDHEKTVCYAEVTDCIADIMMTRPYRLIETVADRMARALLSRFKKINAVTLRVSKPDAPIAANFENVAVTVTHHRMRPVGFSLGSNQGARAEILHDAMTRLGLEDGVEVTAISPLYETQPWGKTDQPAFVNLCVVGRTRLLPHALLRLCKETERQLGRMPGGRWGPRPIDIDLLFLEDFQVQDHLLTLPHAHLSKRAFVLVPLADIAADVKISGKTVRQLLQELPREAGDVRPYRQFEDDA